MALNLIRTITILRDYDIFLTDDVVRCYWNDSTEAIVVQRNASTITTGPPLIHPILNPWFSAGLNTRYQYYDSVSGNTYTFPNIITFPYQQQTSYNPGGGIDDIVLSLVSTTGASTATATDGALEVSATGTNTPFLFSLQDPNEIEDSDMQSSGVFGSLTAGLYTVYAKDSQGNIDSISVNIHVIAETYGIRWTFSYYDNLDKYRKVDILERGYSSGSTQINGGANPIQYGYRGQNSDLIELGIIPSEIQFTVDSSTVDQFIDIARADERKYRINEYLYNGTTFDIKWSGFIDPFSYRDQIKTAPYQVSFNANDGLRDLKYKKFLNYDPKGNEIPLDAVIKGNITHLTALYKAFNLIGLGLGCRIACNIFELSHTTGSSSLGQTYFDPIIYLEKEDDVKTIDRVIKDILSLYQAVLFSYQGYWYVVRLKEFTQSSISYFEYDSNGDFVGSSSWSPRIDFGSPDDATSWRWKGSQPRTFTRPYKEVTIKPNVKTKEHGLFDSINLINVVYSNGEFSRIKGFNLNIANSGFSNAFIKRSGEYFWRLGLFHELDQTSASYIEKQGTISMNNSDLLQLKIVFLIYHEFLIEEFGLIFGQPPFYYLKWSFQVGSKYYNRNGFWSDSPTVNYEYVEPDGNDINVSMDIVPYAAISNQTYSLRVYAVALVEPDESFDSYTDITTALATDAAYETGSRQIGEKIIMQYENGNRSYNSYWELIESTDATSATFVRPNDFHSTTNPTGWRKMEEHIYGVVQEVNTYSSFKIINIEHRPNGEQFDFDSESTSVINSSNIEKLTIDWNQFDLYFIPNTGQQSLLQVQNSKDIVANYIKLIDGEPTGWWYETAGSFAPKYLVSHAHSWLVSVLKYPRERINGGSIVLTVNFGPINVFRDTGRDNKIYMLIGGNANHRRNQVTGEFLEITSDTNSAETGSAFTTGFKQDAVN